MVRIVLAIAAFAYGGAAFAQSPAVPLRDNTPSRETTVATPPSDPPPPNGAATAAADPNARNRPNGPVAPPAALNSGVQIIAPEKK